MGYYSDVALCLSKNGMDQLKSALIQAERNNPENFAAIKMLIAGEPAKLMKAQASLSFCGRGKSGTQNLTRCPL